MAGVLQSGSSKDKVLITGAAGFVGSQLGHHLESLSASVSLLDDMSFGHLDNLIMDVTAPIFREDDPVALDVLKELSASIGQGLRANSLT